MGNKLTRRGNSESTFTKPTGLYPKCEWDDKTVKKLINKKKIAPRYPGREEQSPELDECPICFLWYPGGLNRSKCCKQPICTECFLQFKKPTSLKPIQCPFCNAQNYTVKYSGCKTKEEREAIEQEEQKVIEAKIRMRKEELEREAVREVELAAEREKRLKEGPPPEPPRPQPQAAATRSENDTVHRHRSSRQRTSGGLVPAHTAEDNRDSSSEPPEDEDIEGMDGGELPSEIEELMVMEAIRLSLLDTAGQRSADEEREEAGPGRRVGEMYEANRGSVKIEDKSANDEEDWPAVTWGEDGHEAGMLPPSSTPNAALARSPVSAFETEIKRVGLEMESDPMLFELLMDGIKFFAGPPPRQTWQTPAEAAYSSGWSDSQRPQEYAQQEPMSPDQVSPREYHDSAHMHASSSKSPLAEEPSSTLFTRQGAHQAASSSACDDPDDDEHMEANLNISLEFPADVGEDEVINAVASSTAFGALDASACAQASHQAAPLSPKSLVESTHTIHGKSIHAHIMRSRTPSPAPSVPSMPATMPLRPQQHDDDVSSQGAAAQSPSSQHLDARTGRVGEYLMSPEVPASPFMDFVHTRDDGTDECIPDMHMSSSCTQEGMSPLVDDAKVNSACTDQDAAEDVYDRVHPSSSPVHATLPGSPEPGTDAPNDESSKGAVVSSLSSEREDYGSGLDDDDDDNDAAVDEAQSVPMGIVVQDEPALQGITAHQQPDPAQECDESDEHSPQLKNEGLAYKHDFQDKGHEIDGHRTLSQDCGETHVLHDKDAPHTELDPPVGEGSGGANESAPYGGDSTEVNVQVNEDAPQIKGAQEEIEPSCVDHQRKNDDAAEISQSHGNDWNLDSKASEIKVEAEAESGGDVNLDDKGVIDQGKAPSPEADTVVQGIKSTG